MMLALFSHHISPWSHNQMHCLRIYNGDRRFIWPQPQCRHDSNTSGSWGYIWCQARKYVPMFGQIPGDRLIFPIVNHVVLWYVLSQMFFPLLGCIYHLFYKGVCFYSHISYCSTLGCEDFVPGLAAWSVKGLLGNDVIQPINFYLAPGPTLRYDFSKHSVMCLSYGRSLQRHCTVLSFWTLRATLSYRWIASSSSKTD